MFKLKKILNQRCNAPEVELQRVYSDLIAKKGMIFIFFDGTLSNELIDTQKIGELYYCLSDKKDGYVACCRVTPDMIFEVEQPKSSSSPNVGKLCSLQVKDIGTGYENIMNYPPSVWGVLVLDKKDKEDTDIFTIKFKDVERRD